MPAFEVSKAMWTILWDLDWNAGEIPFNFDVLPLSFFCIIGSKWWKVISFPPLYIQGSPWQAGGRRQKTLLICNPLSFPLPPDTTFCQNFFPFISTLLALQLRGVHFKHWVNMNLSETFSVKIFTQLKSFLYQEPRQRQLRFRMSGVGVNLIWGKRWVRKFADSGTESDR